MLDIKLIRESPELVKKNLEKRNDKEIIRMFNELIGSDKKWRDALKKTEALKRERNAVALEINELKKDKKDISGKIEEMKKVSGRIKNQDETVGALKENVDKYLMKLPNILHESVPSGKSDEDNIVVKEAGEKTKFKFAPKSHVDLLMALDVADTEKAGEISGARFYYLKNELVLLDYALMKFAMDILLEKGFVPIEPPYMMRRKPYEGVTDMADFENVMYKIENEDLYLIATSEHPIAALHMNESLNEEELPKKYAGISPCFRKEAGAHGKDTKGIFRVHQFNKIEQFVFCKPEDSWKIHEALLKNAEIIFKKLKLPYRIVNVCTGEIGTLAAKKYDMEVWMPAQKKYREVISCSNCTDYQARRLNIKMTDEKGIRNALHTLNSTAIATSRTIVAILENYQQEDGSVKIPSVLVPYMNGITKIERRKS